MGLGSFLKLVEIQTKLASMTPFMLGSIYAAYRFERFNGLNFLIMLVSLLCFDMFTTALNNFLDYKRANKRHGYNYETHNSIVRYGLKEGTVMTVMCVLLAVAVGTGLLLFLRTDLMVLGIGALSFLIGICYSFGPVPISRTPLGEVLSGLFMGFIIVFLSAYIHVQDLGLIVLSRQAEIWTVSLRLPEILYIFLVSLPAVAGIANIMLANNICDIEDDLENHRFTLPIYIGKPAALKLFKGLYYMAYVDLVILAVFHIIPIISLLMLLTLIPVTRNLQKFDRLQTKKDTFGLAVMNFLTVCGAEVLLLGLGALLQRIPLDVLHFLL